MNHDEILGCSFIQREKSQKITYDSVLLPYFIKIKKNNKVMELGSGNGVASILLKKLNYEINFYSEGMEIQRELYEDSIVNANLNCMDINFYNTDIRRIPKEFYGGYDIVFSNPPYMKFNNGKVSPYMHRDIARRELYGGIADFTKAANLLLKNKGKFYLIWRSERLQELFVTLNDFNLKVKIVKPIYASESIDSYAALIMAIKNGKFGLKIQQPIYIRKNGKLSEEIKKLYSI